VQGSGIAAMPGLASFSVFGGPINSRVRRCSIQRRFHRHEPLLIEIVQRIDEILWNICRFAHALHKAFPLRPRQSFDFLEYLFGSHLNLGVNHIDHLFQAIAIIR